jgi:hypothetical protein
VIENLGTTEDQFDGMDLSDNSIVRLEGFPRLPRLKHLYLANNRVGRVAPGVHLQLPNLETLVLTNNKMERLEVRSSSFVARLVACTRLPFSRAVLSIFQDLDALWSLPHALWSWPYLLLLHCSSFFVSLPTFQDLDVLGSFPKLWSLSLMDNPVARHRDYRSYVIARCAALKWLDFKKVWEGILCMFFYVLCFSNAAGI